MSFCIVQLLHINYTMRLFNAARLLLAFSALLDIALASPRNDKNVMPRTTKASVIKPKIFIIDMV